MKENVTLMASGILFMVLPRFIEGHMLVLSTATLLVLSFNALKDCDLFKRGEE